MNMDYLRERFLCFKYGSDEETKGFVNKLCDLLTENNIDFVCYWDDGESKYYPCEFVVRRCGKRWNDIMALINTVKAAKYDYRTKDFYISDEVKRGNIQEVCICN